MIELSDLLYLVTVKDSGTLSAASEILHISQPVLTRSMQKLEAEFGVPLFERSKNRLKFNEDGILAVGYARKILDQTQNMIDLVRTQSRLRSTVLLDSSVSGPMLDLIQRLIQRYPGILVSSSRNEIRMRRTLSIGSCASMPMLALLEKATSSNPNMEITAEIKSDDLLLQGLAQHKYQLIILPHIAEEPDFTYQECDQEQLMAALPQDHSLANRKGIYMTDLDGESVALLDGNGYWRSLAARKMPRSTFPEFSAANFITELFQLPDQIFFTSDHLDAHLGHPENRVLLPILDKEALVTYYAVYRQSDLQRLSGLF